jgi:WD40 repeat protein
VGSLPVQLLGRLRGELTPGLLRLVAEARAWRGAKAWLRPVGSTLHAPGHLQTALIGHAEPVHAVAILKDGRVVSGSGDHRQTYGSKYALCIWDTSTGECDFSLTGHSDLVQTVVVLADGRIVSGSQDGTCRVWNATTGECEHELKGHFGGVFCVVEVMKMYIVSGSADHTLRVWLKATGTTKMVLEGHTHSVFCAAALPNWRIVSGSKDHTLRIWSLFTGQCEHTLVGHEEVVNAVTLLQDGRILSGSGDCTLRLWNASTGACERTLAGHTKSIFCVAELHGRITSGSVDSTLRLWDAATGTCERILAGHSSTIMSVVALADGRIVSCSADATLCVWDVGTGECERTLTGHSDAVIAVAVLPDGRVVSGAQDNKVLVWNTTADDPPPPARHTQEVFSLVKLSNGHVFTASCDQSMRIWDPRTGACELHLNGDSGDKEVAVLLPDGRILTASAKHRLHRGFSDDGPEYYRLRVWSASTGDCDRSFTREKYGDWDEEAAALMAGFEQAYADCVAAHQRAEVHDAVLADMMKAVYLDHDQFSFVITHAGESAFLTVGTDSGSVHFFEAIPSTDAATPFPAVDPDEGQNAALYRREPMRRLAHANLPRSVARNTISTGGRPVSSRIFR